MRSAPTIAAAILGMILTTAGVRAQAPAGLVTLPTPDAHVPGVSVSVGFGTHFLTGYSTFTGPGTTGPASTSLYKTVPTRDLSVQVPLRDSLFVEGEVRRVSADGGFPSFSRIVGGVEYGSLPHTPCAPPQCTAFLGRALHESRDVLNIGANLLFRAGTPRMATFFGAGFGIQRTDGRLDIVVTCEAKVPGGCDSRPSEETLSQPGSTIDANLRAIYGVEVVVAPRLAAFAAFRWTTIGRTAYDSSALSGLGMSAGMRVAVSTKSVPLAAQEVRVTGMNGNRRKGRLMMSSNTEVILRQDGRDVHLPLADIRRVEKVSHHARTGALIGTALAAVLWTEVAMTRDSCADCEDGPNLAAFMTPIVIGSGAGIGAIVNRTTRDRHLLYLGRRPTSSVMLSPTLSPKHAGLNVGVRW